MEQEGGKGLWKRRNPREKCNWKSLKRGVWERRLGLGWQCRARESGGPLPQGPGQGHLARVHLSPHKHRWRWGGVENKGHLLHPRDLIPQSDPSGYFCSIHQSQLLTRRPASEMRAGFSAATVIATSRDEAASSKQGTLRPRVPAPCPARGSCCQQQLL